MKTLKLFALAACALLFSQCKTTAPTAPTGPIPSLLEVAQILDSTHSKFLAYTESNNGDAHQAIMQTASWLQSQHNIASATTLDSIYITIVLKSGLRTAFFFDEVGADSLSLFKGGGGSGSSKQLKLSGSSVLSKNVISNKNVLIYCAGCDEFYHHNEIQTTVDILEGSIANLNVQLLKNADCTYPIVYDFQNYGFVIIDTHGFPDGFMIGTTIVINPTINTDDLFKASIVSQGSQDMLDKLMSGQLSFFDHIKGGILQPYWWKYRNNKVTYLNLFLTTKYIDALPPMPNTVIFGSMCYSGYGNPLTTGYTPIKTSFMNKNPISYYSFAFDYGASAPVGTKFAKQMEDTLSKDLADYLDSTKIANLKQDNISEYSDPNLFYIYPKLYFKHFGADDYSYPVPCGDTLVDPRDGHRYATVCIGKQKWMAENLDYDVPGSLCYNSDAANCKIYGKLYDYTTLMNGAQPSTKIPSGVQGVCPKGWHVPSDSEFRIMVKFLGGTDFGGGAVGGFMKSTSSLWKSPNTGATNSSGFSALPAGDGVTASLYENVGKNAEFNTSTATVAPTYIAPTIYTLDASSNLITPGVLGDAARSCRCVKDP